MTRANSSTSRPRHNGIRSLRPGLIREIAAPISDHGPRKCGPTTNHVNPSTELHNESVGAVDDLAADIPISGPELEVIETYLGSLLNGILGEK